MVAQRNSTMAFVSTEVFERVKTNTATALDEVRQSIIKLRGDLVVFDAQREDKDQRLTDACDTRMSLIEVRGNQLISDVQEAQMKTETLHQIMNETFKELQIKTEEMFTQVQSKLQGIQGNNESIAMSYRMLYDKTEVTFIDMQKKIETMNKGFGGRATSDGWGQDNLKRKGYMPINNMMPQKLNPKAEDWLVWRHDVLDYVDVQTEGVAKLLLELGKHDGADIELQQKVVDYVGDKGERFREEDGVAIWRALKRLTEGTAQKLVMNVKQEDGFMAWVKLNRYFIPQLDLQQGAALQDLTSLILTRAKDPAETKQMMLTYQSKVKLAEDHNRSLSSEYLKSILIGIIDPTTRKHTVSCQGKSVDAETFEREILKFVNGVAEPATSVSTATPMQIGAVNAAAQDSGNFAENWWNYEDYKYVYPDTLPEDEHLWALKGKGEAK